MNSRNSKTSDPPRLLLNLSDKINLKRSDKYVASSNLSIHHIWKNIKKSCKNNKFKISAPTWNERLYSVSDVQDYFKYIIKKHDTVTDYPPLSIDKNQIENRITFRVKTGYYLTHLMPETIKLLGRSKNNITKDEDGENVSRLEITEVVLVHCKTVNNDYQQNLKVLYSFVPNKSFGQLFSPQNFIL